MKRTLLTAAAASVLLALGAGAAVSSGQHQAASPPATPAITQHPATPEGAAAFVAEAEERLMALSEYVGRVAWVRATHITFDTMWLEARANAEFTELQVALANEAARFNDVEVPDDVRHRLAGDEGRLRPHGRDRQRRRA